MFDVCVLKTEKCSAFPFSDVQLSAPALQHRARWGTSCERLSVTRDRLTLKPPLSSVADNSVKL